MSTPSPEAASPTAENMDELDGVDEAVVDIPLDPLLSLLYLRHTIASPYSTAEEKASAKEAMWEEVEAHKMAPYIRLVQEGLGWSIDETILSAMDKENDKKIEAIQATMKDAQENLGDTEVRDALQAMCNHYARIGDWEKCMQYSKECAAKTLAPGPKFDLYLQRVRLGLAFSDNDIAADAIRDAHRMIKDADWERRNRLKVYEGLYQVFVRNFERGSQLLLDSITTFASGELISFKDFILVTIVSSLPSLARPELKKKIVDSPEVISADVTDIYELVTSIYTCRYRDVFPAVDVVCHHMRAVVYLSPHVNFFFRAVRALVFTQFLDSYSSVTLDSMGEKFGIPVSVLDHMLQTLISNEKIACKVDRVNNSITTYRGDTVNFDYHHIVKSGDLLLNRVQKLSRLVDM